MEDNKIKTGLWEKTSQRGNIFYSGVLDTGDKKYFANLYVATEEWLKENPKRPPYTIELQEIIKTNPEKDPYEEFGNSIEITDDDLPF